MGGNDTVTGNGSTRVSYQPATGAVTVNLATGTATGNASVGTDTFTAGVNAVRGSNFADTLIGSNASTTEFFEGWGGDDSIDGAGGFDVARYDNNNTGVLGISVTRTDAGTSVTGRDAQATNVIGTDTLTNVEGVRGTNLDDIYLATGSGFNEFEGMGGGDVITGNGNTRVSYQNSGSAVAVDLAGGTATGAGADAILGGVNAVRGSNFADTIAGSGGSETFQGGAGGDLFVFHAGFGSDTISDFVGNGAAPGDSVQFDVAMFADYAAVAAASAQVGGNVVITSGANTLTLTGVTLAGLDQSDFVFV